MLVARDPLLEGIVGAEGNRLLKTSGRDFSAPRCPHWYAVHNAWLITGYRWVRIEWFWTLLPLPPQRLSVAQLWVQNKPKCLSQSFGAHPPLQPVQPYLLQTHPCEAPLSTPPPLLVTQHVQVAPVPRPAPPNWEGKRWMQVLEVGAGRRCRQPRRGDQWQLLRSLSKK